MRFADISGGLIGGVLGNGGMFGMAQRIAENPQDNFGLVGNALLNDGRYYGVVSQATGINEPIYEGMGLPGFDAIGNIL